MLNSPRRCTVARRSGACRMGALSSSPSSSRVRAARIRLVEDRRNFARGEVVELLQSSPQRIQPRCPHFAACGGCHYQHLDYAQQLDVKSAVLRDHFARIGRISDLPLRPIVPSPHAWNYRNSVQFHLGVDGKLGFQAANGSGVMAVSECHLPEEALNILWPQLDLEPVPGLRSGHRAAPGRR